MPVEWPAVEVHYGIDEQPVAAQAVNDGVGKVMEIELAVVVAEHPPSFRFGDDAVQCDFKLVEEVLPKAGLPFFLLKDGSLQLLIGFRMGDDVHEAWRGDPGRCLPRGGH